MQTSTTKMEEKVTKRDSSIEIERDMNKGLSKGM